MVHKKVKLDLGVDSRSRLESTWRFRVDSSRFYLLKSTSKSNSRTEVTSSRFCPKSTWKRLEAKFTQLSSRTVGLLLRFLDAYYNSRASMTELMSLSQSGLVIVTSCQWHKMEGWLKMQDLKLTDQQKCRTWKWRTKLLGIAGPEAEIAGNMKLKDQVTGHEIAGHSNRRYEILG